MRSLWLLLVVTLAIGCSAAEDAPALEEVAGGDALAALGMRFTAARALISEARPAAITRDDGRWRLREALPSTRGPWQAIRRPLEVQVASSGRFTVGRRGGEGVTVERAAVARIDRGPDHLGLRDAEGALVGAWLATPRGLEELVVEEGSLRYRLELPRGWRMRQPKGREELVELRDAHGVPQLRFVARWAFDNEGGQHRLRTRIDGDGIVVEAPSDRGPLLIDPEWQVTEMPPHDPQGALTTLLADGDVLIVGGGGIAGAGREAARFDTTTRRFTVLPDAQFSRALGTATLLEDGRVLLAGGFGLPLGERPEEGFPVELFDPQTETFVAGIDFEPSAQTATRIASGPHAGEVLLAGGLTNIDPGGAAGSAAAMWWFDPSANGGLGALSEAGNLAQARGSHRAVPLPDGDVVFVGGFGDSGTLASVERFDGSESVVVGSLPSPRHATTALLLPQPVAEGQLLVAGGLSDLVSGGLGDVSLYDLATNVGTSVGSLSPARGSVVATLLPTGDALLLGGGDNVLETSASGAERFDAMTGTLSATEAPPGGFAVTTGIILPGGETLVLGAQNSPLIHGPQEYATVDIVDTMAVAMAEPSVTVLSTGKALITEGGPAEVFDPDTQTFETLPGGLPGIGRWHRATTLLDGRVLYTGGLDGSDQAMKVAVIYDPASGQVDTSVGNMSRSRAGHTQTLLPDGRVLVAGGFAAWDDGNPVPAWAEVELFDPTTKTFQHLISTAGSFAFGQAMALGDGKIWLWDGFSPLSDADEDTWTFDLVTLVITQLGTGQNPDPLNLVGAAVGARVPDGRLFVVDETGAGKIVDPTGAVPTVPLLGSLWSSGAPPSRAPAVVPLPSGRIVVVDAEGGELHLVDPAREEVTTIAEPAAARWTDAAALLPDGGVLLAGAIAEGPPSDTVTIWYERPVREGWRPRLDPFDSVGLGETTTLTGSGLLGVSEGISATSMGPANAPVVTFLYEDGGMVRGPSTGWGDDTLTWTPGAGAFPGTGMIWVSTMGIPGGRPGAITPGGLGAACLSEAGCDSGHCVDGVCCDSLCDGLCAACSAAAKGLGDSSQDGICEIVQAGVAEPACEIEAVATCGQNGLCDAEGQCAAYPEGTVCDEAETEFCYQGDCVERVCDGDHTIVEIDGERDCTPYVCATEPIDACLSSCETNLDCVEGFVCGAGGDCIAPQPAADRIGCTPCALGRRAPSGAAWAWLVGLTIALLRRRRLSAGQSEGAAEAER